MRLTAALILFCFASHSQNSYRKWDSLVDIRMDLLTDLNRDISKNLSSVTIKQLLEQINVCNDLLWEIEDWQKMGIDKNPSHDTYIEILKSTFLSNAYNWRAYKNYRIENYKEALSDWKKSNSYLPKENERADVYYNIALCYARLNAEEQCCESMRTARRLGYDGAADFIKDYCR